MLKQRRKGATAKGGRPAAQPKAKAVPRTNEQWSAASIEELIRLARREFARHGYVDTSVDRIAAKAKLTKGAVYYHFGSKEGLFEAVLHKVQQDLVARIEARADQSATPFEALRAGCEVFLELATDDELRQILLADGPTVLGWSKWRAIDAEYGLGSLKRGLEACREVGAIAANDVDLDVLAHWLSGALNEGVFLIADSSSRPRALEEAKRALSILLLGLLPASRDPQSARQGLS